MIESKTDNSMPDIDSIRASLGRYQPQQIEMQGGRHAAVSMLLREREAIEVLLIQRAFFAEDPWSGQMAFPGGMREAIDSNSRDAAERETMEEVGVDLTQHAYIGRLDDQQHRHAGHPTGLVVSGHVYRLLEDVVLNPNYEVADLLWVPLPVLLDRSRLTEIRHPRAPGQTAPGILLDADKQQIVWGLTRRFLIGFFQIANIPHPH